MDARGITAAEHGVLGAAIIGALSFLAPEFGGKLMTDYIARGVTQSDHKPAVTAYGELRYNATDAIQLYAGTQLWSVKLPTDPAVEADI